jgi:hypothetical protein
MISSPKRLPRKSADRWLCISVLYQRRPGSFATLPRKSWPVQLGVKVALIVGWARESVFKHSRRAAGSCGRGLQVSKYSDRLSTCFSQYEMQGETRRFTSFDETEFLRYLK